MSILDDTKRAIKGAKPLLRLIVNSTPDTFEQYMDEYTREDGIIGTDFLPTLERAKDYLKRLGEPGTEEEFFDYPIEFQMAFIEQIVQNEQSAFFLKLMETVKDKQVKKILKRRIHEMKSQGIEFSGPKKKGGFKFKPVVEPEPGTIVSESNSMGEREIFYASRHPRSGIRLLYVVSHFAEGVVEFNYFETSRSGLRDMIKSLRSDSALEIFDVGQSLGYYFLETAKKRNEQSGRPLPSRFMTVFQDFPRPEGVPDSSPIWNHVPRDETEDRFSEYLGSASLHESIEFRNWILPSDILQKVELRFSEILYSTVLVNEAQKEQQVEQLIIDTVDQYFDEATRNIWISRLEDSALLLALNERNDTAVLALTVAKALAQPGRAASSIPFCEGLLRKLIRKSVTDHEEKSRDDEPQTNTGGIILP